MEVIVGKYQGFCSGVSNTYKRALEEVKKGKIYCLGKIIHNELVIKELEDLGMITVDNIEDVKDNSRLIFRAHGEPLSSYEYAKEHNIEVVDLTCGKVRVIHNKVKDKKKDYFIVIIGKKSHPEIIGTIGYALPNYYVIENEEDIDNLKQEIEKTSLNKVFVISQTTFSSSKFDLFKEKIEKSLKDFEIIFDKSICESTENRQNECLELSKKCDIMLVLGGENSSNTRELYNIAKKNTDKVYYVSDLNDISKIEIKDKDSVIGIVAGASTPNSFIELVKDKVRVIN